LTGVGLVCVPRAAWIVAAAMDLGLRGKVALVSGGSAGLGRAAAGVLAHEGASIALFARDSSRADVAATEIRDDSGAHVVPMVADVTSLTDCERVVSETTRLFGRVDVLVTSMGGPPYGGAADRSDEEWQRAWELVTLSVIRLCRAAAAAMMCGGSIVNITTPGVHQVIPGTALSTVARSATTAFTKYLATELAPRGIRVNNVLPGWIDTRRVTDLTNAEAAARGIPAEELHRRQTAEIPLGRYGTAAEVAHAIVFLASPRSSYITGTNLRVDGGWAMSTAV
jgi:3-oxoacyl-[acyl-carrier protein] reductase